MILSWRPNAVSCARALLIDAVVSQSAALAGSMQSTEALRIAMVAGESSGDLLGSRVIKALRSAFPGRALQFEGVGGEAMLEQGFHSYYPLERLAVMGLVEPLGRLPELLNIRRDLRKRWSTDPPALFLGVDAPDFNLGLAKSLRGVGLHTAQLVSPTVWAWRPGRVHTVARAVDQIFCLFPFEPPLYKDVAVKASYVGHPLVNELAEVPSRQEARQALGIDADAQVIALLPGSRGSEVEQLTRLMVSAGRLLKSRDSRRCLILPAANAERLRQCRALLEGLGATDNVRLIEKNSRQVMTAADAIMLASGTASLEAMLLERPMVIAYRVAAISWTLMSRLAVTPFVGLPNILAGKKLVPELLQDQLSAPELALETEILLRDGAKQVESLSAYRASLARDFDAALPEALGPLLGAGEHG